MKKSLLLFILCIGATNLLYAQSILPPPNDTIKPISPPIRIFSECSNYTIEFTTTNSSLYLFSIEKSGEELLSEEILLRAGESHIIDLSTYPAGIYRVIIRDIIYSKEYEYLFSKEDNTAELF